VTTTKQLTWTDTNGYARVHIIDPETTTVKAVAEAGEKFLEAHAQFTTIERERSAAQSDVRRRTAEAKVEAREAGTRGEKFDAKKSRKVTREKEERLAEIDLGWEAGSAALRAQSRAYAELVKHHAPALAAEAKSEADAAILSLASAAAIARRAEANVTGSLSILGGLQGVRGGEAFTPRAPKARREVADELGEGGVPGPYVGTAVAHLGTAIGLATRILDDLKAAEAEQAKRAKVEADDAADGAAEDPDEVPYTDEEDDDE
jgi:hypothetical protein